IGQSHGQGRSKAGKVTELTTGPPGRPRSGRFCLRPRFKLRIGLMLRSIAAPQDHIARPLGYGALRCVSKHEAARNRASVAPILRDARTIRANLRNVCGKRAPQDEGGAGAVRNCYPSSPTVLRNTPICGAATSTTSPGLSHTEGFRCTPAPVGVPVQIKSPGLSVANVLM